MTRNVNSVDTSSAPRSSHARTHGFARLIGPYLVIAPSIIALRLAHMDALTSEFFKSSLFVWFTGAWLLIGGLVIIAFHQYWSSVAAVLISLFGWFLAIRGLVLMAAPKLYEQAGLAMESMPNSMAIVRLIFGVLAAIGLYLTYVGWIAKPASSLATNKA